MKPFKAFFAEHPAAIWIALLIVMAGESALFITLAVNATSQIHAGITMEIH